jgi:hypothetical protein
VRLLNTITVRSNGHDREVRLAVGDLAALPASEAVDILVVSAFPNNYLPTSGSVIGALFRRGISVEKLAANKEVDLRKFSSCWLSREIDLPGVHFRRVLCFEPAFRGEACEVVGDIFRSLIPFTTLEPPIARIALPLVASGDQGESSETMLDALTEAAVHWIQIGLQVECILIVLHKSAQLKSLEEVFSRVQQRHIQPQAEANSAPFRFDMFISYASKNAAEVDVLVNTLRAERPSLRVFVDRFELRQGVPWQSHIFDAIDASRKVLCVLSSDYVVSKVCKEEFNIAMIRHRESAESVMLILYLYTATLPTYMKLFQYLDAREGNAEKIARAARTLIDEV